MSTNNYGEILCTAIDEIISKRFEDLSYDISKVCTIVDDSSRKNGKYVVTDGSVRFEAYSTDTDLSQGNSVMVTIPNGDYTMQKTIIGRIAADDTTPFIYTSPLDNMIKITNNIFDSDDAIKNKGSLLANDKGTNPNVLGTTTSALYSLASTTGEFSGFTRLGVSADFKSWLADLGAVSGSYGIAIIVYFHDLSAPGEGNGKPNSRTYILDTSDMIGNPYYFDSYFTQEKVFDISDINTIEEIDVRFFQNGDFKNVDGELIPFEMLDPLTGTIEKLSHNLFVDDVKIMLGYEMSAFEGETLLLSTPDGLTYHYNDENFKKEINLRWIHKIDDTHYTLLNGSKLPSNCSVRWFRHSPGYAPPEGQFLDEFAGKDWEPIQGTYSTAKPRQSGYDISNKCKLHFIPNSRKQNELIKAIGIITTITNEPTGEFDDAGNEKTTIKEQVVHYVCKDNLKLENEEYVPDSLTVEAATALQIVCEDGSEGNYFLYNQNGKINNEGEGQGKRRTLKALYQGLELTPSLGKLDFIEWWLPSQEQFTMLIAPDEYYTENKGVKKDGLHYNSVTYSSSTRKTGSDKKLTSTQMTYSIGNQWSQQKSNNTVRCRASINGTVYEATAELRFGKAGTNGTNQTFLIEFDNNENALTINNFPYEEQMAAQTAAAQALSAAINNTASTPEELNALQAAYEVAKLKDIVVRARLYDANGSRIDFTTEQAGQIEWEWFKYSTDNDGNDKGYIVFSGATKGSSLTLICNINTIPDDNYYILKAKYNGLEAYLPIPLKTSRASFIEGAREVIYDHQGNPSYYSDAYMLYYLNVNNEYEAVNPAMNTWTLSVPENIDTQDPSLNAKAAESNKKLLKSYLPQLKALDKKGKGYMGLSASPMYAAGFNDKVCVSTYLSNLGLGWSQPILIMQSRYDFAMLNDWDGKLNMDDETGAIMATMLGAGRKNPDNTFSGVMIGDVGKGTKKTDTATLTGVYGLHRGEFSFALKEDGTAFFGKAGRGQIKLNGNDGTIMSSSYATDNIGMKIDLDDGIIDIVGPNKDHYDFIPMDQRSEEDCKNELYLYEQGGLYYTYKGSIQGSESVPLYKYRATNASVYISPTGKADDPYFRIKSYEGNPIMHVASDNYYLASDNRGEHSGSLLDLNNGVLNIKSTAGEIYLSGGGTENNEYFRISVPRVNPEDNIIRYDNHLFLLNDNDYYLQSEKFGNPNVKMAIYENNIDHKYNTYTATIITSETLEDDPINAKNKILKVTQKDVIIALKDKNIYLVDDSLFKLEEDKHVAGYYYFSENNKLTNYGSSETYVVDSQSINGYRKENLNAAEVESRFRKTFALNYYPIVSDLYPATDNEPAYFMVNNITKITTAPEGVTLEDLYKEYKAMVSNEGFRLDLKNSRIEGYSLSMRGINSEGKGSFTLDSGAEEIPFTIGDNFKVSWDGTLNCNKINTLNNDGNSDKVISINNNFSVSKSGGASGSGCSFGGSFTGYGSFYTIARKGDPGVIDGGFVVGGESTGSNNSDSSDSGTSMSLSTMVSKIAALEEFMQTFVESYNSTAHTHSNPSGAETITVKSVSGSNSYTSTYSTNSEESHSHKVYYLDKTVATQPKGLSNDLKFTPGGDDSDSSTDT